MGTHKHHRYLTGARKAKADEFYTTYDAIDRELSHYRHDLAGRHVICDCNDRPGMSMFVRWTLDHMSEYGIASLTCTSFQPDHDTLFDDGTPAMQWHVDNDGREGRYSIADLAARPLDGDGSFDSPECERLLDRPGAIVVTNPPFSKAIRFMRMLRRHPDTDFLIVANLNLATANDVFPMVKGGTLPRRPEHPLGQHVLPTARRPAEDGKHDPARRHGRRQQHPMAHQPRRRTRRQDPASHGTHVPGT